MSQPKKVKIIALACERSVDFKDELTADGCLKSCDSVRVIQVPCSGHIQPNMIDAAFKSGAEGVITTGCRIGDCHYREGNKFLKERLEGKRAPKMKPGIDKKRLRAYWLSAVETSLFKDMANEFNHALQSLSK